MKTKIFMALITLLLVQPVIAQEGPTTPPPLPVLTNDMKDAMNQYLQQYQQQLPQFSPYYQQFPWLQQYQQQLPNNRYHSMPRYSEYPDYMSDRMIQSWQNFPDTGIQHGQATPIYGLPFICFYGSYENPYSPGSIKMHEGDSLQICVCPSRWGCGWHPHNQ
ncbi:MAG: hypothetical protein OXF20_09995 [Gammaproteobacteria bacterium]|nr:hypothetical protein [Gammaproteobacteria bacterium]